MAEVPEIFNQPGAAFVLMPTGVKYPPTEKEWQKKPHSFDEVRAHRGNIGIMAGSGRVGLDQDDPSAFRGLVLPITTTWETRPGRLGMWLQCSDVAEALASIGKKADQAQLKLFKDGMACGEVKLQRAYQVIPNSWKKLEDGTRADYKLLSSEPPAEISLVKLLADLQSIGITFSSKLETNAAKLEANGKKARQRRAETDETRVRKYAEAALRDEVLTLASTSQGSRNEQLNKSAFALGQFVAAKVLSENKVVSELSKAAMNVGMEPEEIHRTITSGLESGTRHPREIPEKHVGGNGAGAPALRIVTLDDPTGSVGLDFQDGCIKKVDLDKDGQKVWKWLSDCALGIHTETSAKDATEFNFRGAGAKDNRSVSFTLPATSLADPRKFRAALINAFGAKNRVGALEFEMVQRITRNTMLLMRVEVPTWGGSIPFLPGVNLAGNVEHRALRKVYSSKVKELSIG